MLAAVSMACSVAFAPLIAQQSSGESASVPTGVAAREGQTAAATLADHVVLISIDGLRPEFYLDRASWGAPTLQQMASAGVHAQAVRGVFPSVTYPSHTTLVTGALPARHGILYNSPFEAGGQTGRWYWESDSIRVPTLFSALREQGRTTAAVMWPVTLNAPMSFLLPEYWSLDRTKDRVQTLREVSTPGLLAEVELEATGRLSSRNFSGDDMTRDDRLGAAAAYLLETRKPALLAVHLVGTDHFQHEEGRSGPKTERAVSGVDRAVAQIMEAAARAGILERTAFVIAGDHGFVNTHTSVNPNVWLANAGLLDSTRSRGNWRAAFHVEGAAAFLQTRRANDSVAINAARRAVNDAPAAARRLFRFVERDELDLIGADPRVAFALTSQQGVRMGSGAVAPAVRPSSGGTHGYFPSDFAEIRTGFVGWGAGFERGLVVPELGLEDVAPIIAALLGLPFQAPDGMLLHGLLRGTPSMWSVPSADGLSSASPSGAFSPKYD